MQRSPLSLTLLHIQSFFLRVKSVAIANVRCLRWEIALFFSFFSYLKYDVKPMPPHRFFFCLNSLVAINLFSACVCSLFVSFFKCLSLFSLPPNSVLFSRTNMFSADEQHFCIHTHTLCTMYPMHIVCNKAIKHNTCRYFLVVFFLNRRFSEWTYSFALKNTQWFVFDEMKWNETKRTKRESWKENQSA